MWFRRHHSRPSRHRPVRPLLESLEERTLPDGTHFLYPPVNGQPFAWRNVLRGGYAWMDFAETWDETVGTPAPRGTFNYFAVAAHEIGHALGLGHTDGLPGPSIMDAKAGVSLTGPSVSDTSLIQGL